MFLQSRFEATTIQQTEGQLDQEYLLVMHQDKPVAVSGISHGGGQGQFCSGDRNHNASWSLESRM